MKKIPLFRPYYDSREVKALEKVLLSGWIGMGPKTKEFEESFAKYVGAKYGVALNSATSALQLALEVLNIGKGDEVITTPLTFASSSECILQVGAIPVYADVEEETLNINPSKIEELITQKTKAILIVHYGGQPCDIDKIQSIAKKHKLHVIEDAAHACGASYKGKKIGGNDNLTCFSFHAVKNLATGDGGMITTNDPAIDKKLRLMRWLGIDKSTYDRNTVGKYLWDYNIDTKGYKNHMNDIAATLGIVQLSKLDKMNAKRKKISDTYSKIFSDSKNIIPLKIKSDRLSSHHIYCVKLDGIDRADLMAHLSEKGISTGVHYKPLFHHTRYKKFNKKNTPVVESVWQNILSLPVFPGMEMDDVKRVANEIKKYIK